MTGGGTRLAWAGLSFGQVTFGAIDLKTDTPEVGLEIGGFLSLYTYFVPEVQTGPKSGYWHVFIPLWIPTATLSVFWWLVKRRARLSDGRRARAQVE